MVSLITNAIKNLGSTLFGSYRNTLVLLAG
jgi:hypothetical protein